MIRKVVWTLEAKASLDKYYERIAEESPASAKKVRKEIVLAARPLGKHPYMYQLDELYQGNLGDIRRFFRWHYRVVYQVQHEE